jgi:hypothetical protein
LVRRTPVLPLELADRPGLHRGHPRPHTTVDLGTTHPFGTVSAVEPSSLVTEQIASHFEGSSDLSGVGVEEVPVRAAGVEQDTGAVVGEAVEPEPDALIRLIRLLAASVGPFDTGAWRQARIWSCDRCRLRPRLRTSGG